MATFEHIVFMQGDDADEALRILYGKTDDSAVWSGPDHVSAAIAHLAQWDNHESGELPQPESAAGSGDDQAREGNYLLTWNLGLGYIGLERVRD